MPYRIELSALEHLFDHKFGSYGIWPYPLFGKHVS